MSIDPLRVDNPLDRSAVPKEPLPVEFPARHCFIGIAFARLMAITIAVVSLTSAGFYLLPSLDSQIGQWIAGSYRVNLILFVLFMMARWGTKHIAFYFLTLVVAGFSLASIACTMSTSDDGLNAICAFIMIASLWTVAEIGLHFIEFDAHILRHEPVLADERRGRNACRLEVLATAVGIAMCLGLGSPNRLLAVPAIAMAGIVIAYTRSVAVAKHPITFLVSTIEHFYGYPDEASLAPGLIPSCAADRVFRPLPATMVVVSMTTLPIAFGSGSSVLIEAALWAAVAAFVSVSLLMLAASFTARPIHFDVDRTPFDLVIGKLRGTEKTDE